MTLLDLSGLTLRTTNGTTLVDDLSLTLAPGERLGLIGESGSGKSLTALAVLGLLPEGITATGSVELAGTQIVGAREEQLTRVRGRDAAVVFQEPLTALDPLMRAGRQLAEPLRRRHGLRGPALKRAVLDALERVRLAEPDRIARSFPHEISGGQRQRVALAMALACEPKLLIADEPTTALDVSVQAEMLDLIDTLVRERDMAVVFVSHDLAVVARIADRAVVMRQGRAVEEGTVLGLVRSPAHAYTRALVGSARRLESALNLGDPR
ncbi:MULTISPECIES: ATP-binding cassette domain-containing protein [Streptomyces]|uniref:ATP-binding cassette domain-containing protein n=1 Tax=Streptomyces TaxID=1883 RepID=UPI0008052822|nr:MULTISPECIES: ABC transporter ATP-binding protein [unclassified Streptomyces]MYR71684.1 ATP-binding cassette domain-containing protein [Streptomyces sp. SID4925]SBV01389.1 peptide/nickel transport system ATP-binding protein [Streptomyces sp. OspMP-M45]